MIEKTSEYKRFKFLDCNRKIRTKHVEKLINSIEQIDLTMDIPILVDKDFNIIDGQHRFMACKQLKKPIYYKFLHNSPINSVSILNDCQRKWEQNDYVHYHATNGNKEFIEFLEILDRHKITVYLAVNMVGKRRGFVNESIRQGELPFSLDELDQSARFYREFCNHFSAVTVKKDIPLMNNRFFARAVVLISKIPNFNKKRFFKNIELLHSKITRKTTIKDYTSVFLDIYNYKCQHKVKIEDLMREEKEKKEKTDEE